MVKVIQLLILTAFFNGISQEVFISKNSCFKEISFDIDLRQLSGFSEPYEDPDGIFVSYHYLNEDGLRDCSEIFGVWFPFFTIYQQPDNDIFFEFEKVFDSHSYMINKEALLNYLKVELTRLLGEVHEIEPTSEKELKSKIWHWEKDGVFYELSAREIDVEDDPNDYGVIKIYIGKKDTERN